MPDHRLAVLLLTNEGFRQVDGGVARYVHNILDARDQAQSSARERGVEVQWHVAERAQCTGLLDEELFAQALDRYVHGGGVRYHPMADPRAHNWEVDHFEHCIALSAAAGQVMLSVSGTADSVLVVSGMSMFAMAARFVVRAADQFGIAASYVHMTHNPVLRPDGDAELPETYADSVMGHLARHDRRVSVGWESHWMRRQYQLVYGIADDKMLYARAGVPTDAAKFDRIPPDPELLRSLGVPTDRDLVISWGRGVPEKGFDLLIDASRAAEDRLVPVILNPRPYPALAEHVRRTGSPAVLLDGQDDRVLSALCQWPRTLAAAFLSDREAASVTPVEAALMSGGQGLVVAAVPTGVYPELIEDGRTGLIAADRSTAAVAAVLRSIAGLSPAERESMSTAAHERARREHDFRTNWLRSFDEMLDRHLAVIGGVPQQKEE
ncbi:glycosyltransferase involved in cell wall biosynthesis [Allocatelliglobosispora scoriae]|uniref:Glycosyltransferase involved in cell wall biosynthesis n=1 Tax=Allocatelliglobosispora scoriae TaxID=643052 RepID=A0A841BJA0_9ACTN|nr:glycosyltransferase family 4 protein [Allocatelliglobosispora scoriae]MBB5868334.1 glycosyltransferase involved in cell wall biosynthesis [Allocatelliglobosispora scoriae]